LCGAAGIVRKYPSLIRRTYLRSASETFMSGGAGIVSAHYDAN
jgi:hypothetical protein